MLRVVVFNLDATTLDTLIAVYDHGASLKVVPTTGEHRR
jgi:hypothetical protein